MDHFTQFFGAFGGVLHLSLSSLFSPQIVPFLPPPMEKIVPQLVRKDCPDLLCEPCKKKHGDVEDFKSHSVFDLCQVHDEGITHLCKECIKPLCKRCMLLDHTEHKNHFVKYEKGVTELQNDAKIKQENIMKEIRAADKNYEEIRVNYQRVAAIKTACYDQKKCLNDRMKAEDEVLRHKIAELEAASKKRKDHLKERILEADTILKETDMKEKMYGCCLTEIPHHQ